MIVGGAKVDKRGPGRISVSRLGEGNMVVGGAEVEGRGPGVTFMFSSSPIEAAML